MAKDLVLSVAKHFAMASPRTDAYRYQAVKTPSVIVVTTTVEISGPVEVLAPLVVPFREYIIFLVV